MADEGTLSKFVVVSRPRPTEEDLANTAKQIFISNTTSKSYEWLAVALAKAYYLFVRESRDDRRYFTLRDFYDIVIQTAKKITKEQPNDNSQEACLRIAKSFIERNFGVRTDSAATFLKLFAPEFNEPITSTLQLFTDSINDRTASARHILQLLENGPVRDILSTKRLDFPSFDPNSLHLLRGGPFKEDSSRSSCRQLLHKIIASMAQGGELVLQGLPSSVYASLLGLLKKDYRKVGGKLYCRIEGRYHAVHHSFRCIVSMTVKEL